jgi:hypothetical protein
MTILTDFENRLWASAVHEADQAGLTISVPCSRNVKDLIRAGVATMVRESRTGETDTELAEASFARLVLEMIRASRAVGETVLRETAVVQAKKLCPLWPFG